MCRGAVFLPCAKSSDPVTALIELRNPGFEICRTETSKTLFCPMKFEYNLSMAEIIVSYLLMMAVIIIGIFSGQAWLCILGLPLFLRGLMGWCPFKSMLRGNSAA